MSEFVVASNRKAFHDYEILDRIEAGMVLVGTEVKSLRDHRVSFKDSFARILDGELWLEGCHISPYSHGNLNNHEPERRRKLLLHKREIRRLEGLLQKGGVTLIPLRIFFRRGIAKVELGLGKGRRQYDKREVAKKKTIDREIEIEMKRR